MRLGVLAVVVTLLAVAVAECPAAAQVAGGSAEVEAFERELSDALDRRDRGALEGLLADDFTFIHASGALDSRTAYLDRAAAGKLPRQRGETGRTAEPLRVYGGHTAIRISRAVLFEQRVRNVNVYVKVAGRWRLASSQSTRLPERPIAVAVDERLLESYVGTYRIDASRSLVVTRVGATLTGRVPLRPEFELIPKSETAFIRHSDDGGFGDEIVFVSDVEGGVECAVLRDGEKEVWRAQRVE